MKQIIYALEDDYGMHARPASRLAEIKKGEAFHIEITGEDEDEACRTLEKMLKEKPI